MGVGGGWVSKYKLQKGRNQDINDRSRTGGGGWRGWVGVKIQTTKREESRYKRQKQNGWRGWGGRGGGL